MRPELPKFSLYRVFRFFTSRQFFTVAFGVILLVLALKAYDLWLRPDTIRVNDKDKTSPQYPYRKDELALLQISLNKLMEAESQKRYDDIYGELASRRFQKNVPERVFLKMTNCVEQYLGDMVSYDLNNNGFRREKRKGRTVDVLQLHVERSETALEEQIVFEWEGVDVRVGGLYWLTDRRAFHQCIRDVSSKKTHLETTGGIESAVESTEKKSTEIQQVDSNNSDASKPKQEAAPAATDDDEDLKKDNAEPPTTTLQQEAGEETPTSSPVSPAPSERIEPGESSKPME